MKQKTTTQEHLNKIIEFRQAIQTNGFTKQRDALSETLDAIALTGALTSFARLSFNQVFRRQWHSLYKGLERGWLDTVWMSGLLAGKVPQEGVQHYSLDSSAWPRPRARTLDDRQYVYHPTSAVQGGSICVGYPYSLLDCVPEADQSWSLSVSIQRIPSQMTAAEIGIAQVQELNRNRAACSEVLDIVAADGKYGNAKFLRPLQGGHCGLVVRLRRDRVMYRTPEQPQHNKRGRPSIHGKRFAFKEPDTWDEPDEEVTFEHPRWGMVKLECWQELHGKSDVDVPVDVIRASVHLEKAKPPRPIWLAWQPPVVLPANIVVNAATIWAAYTYRWPVEASIRFRKQCLGWTTPQFQHKERGDRWSWLVALAVWVLFLARPIVEDQPLPWQKPQSRLTPQRVQQSLPLIFAQFGSPALKPKRRAKAPGWPRGRPRTPKPHFSVVKKQPVPG